MSEYMVEVGLTANVDQYVQNMGQAVAVTKSYTQVAENINGRVADLNAGIVGLTQKLTGFNKVNTVALDQAASYQKALSGIEAKATLTGKSFETLSKTTKGFARDFPIGMGNAVEVMTAVQQQGIKTEKQMGELGKSFIKLGAATSTNAAVIGTEFLQLSRTMGNGLSQFEKLSDSLVGTTAKIGGSVPSVVAFSKALAPVAATVGLSQTAVIGLSSSMSKLGEDGFQAANSLNKVLLDMNRAIRDGGPELKAYADMMGMTSKQLKDLFKMNPAEVVSRFAEAVAKEGPAISRSLEALGFDSVRTTRSLTALARSGGPREAIATAINEYGSGSTQKAADIAMEGVADQAMKLQETMSQVVQNVGQPLLGVAKVQLQAANAVAGVGAGITESGPGQALLGAGGTVSMLGGMASNVMLAGTAIALAKMGFGKGSNFQEARMAAKTGGPMPDKPGVLGRVGGAIGSAQAGMASGMVMPMGGGGGGGVLGRLADASRALASTSLQLGVKYQDMMNVNPAMRAQGRAPFVTPTGQAFQTASSAALMTAGRLMTGSASMDDARAAARDLRSTGRDFGRDMASRGVTRGFGDVMRTAAYGVGANTALVGSTALQGAAAVGRGLGALGVTPGLVAIGGGIAAGTYIAAKKGESDSARENIRNSTQDIYASFNTFAEASGMAGKGLVSFQAQVEQATNTLVQQNTTMKQALTLTPQEVAQATAQGYNPAFKIIGDNKSASVAAAQAQAMLGSNARPEDVARVLSDITNQSSAANAQQVASILEKSGIGGVKAPEADYNTLLGNIASQGNVLIPGFINETQGQIAALMTAQAGQRAFEARNTYGGKLEGTNVDIGTVTALSEASKLASALQQYSSSETMPAFGAPNVLSDEKAAGVRTAGRESLISQLGLSSDQAKAAGLAPSWFQDQNKIPTFDEIMTNLASYEGPDGVPQIVKDYQAAKNAGVDFSAPTDYARFTKEMPENEKEARATATAFSRLTGITASLTESMFGAEKAARQFGTLPQALTSSEKSGMSFAGRQLQEYTAKPDDAKRIAASTALSKEFQANSKNPLEAIFALNAAAALAPIGYKQEAFSGAAAMASRDKDLYYSGGMASREALDTYRLGLRAQQLPPSTNPTYNSNTQTMITQGMQAQGALNDQLASIVKAGGALQANIVSINRSSGIAAGAVARDARLNEQYTREDYGLQRQYARQDYRTMRQRATRDMGITRERAGEQFERQQQYAGQDFLRQRKYALADFNRQMSYMETDFNKTQLRATEDYNVARERAERDLTISLARANRDFYKAQDRAQTDFQLQTTRATADYNRGRLRMSEDYNKQMKRMTEDSAKGLMDPFKRLQVQMVMDAGQLVSNLAEQGDQLEKQLANLADARGMGLSEQAIKQLGLADAGNAQQLSRLVEDMRNNSDFTSQLNEAVAKRASAGQSLVSDQSNTALSRAAEDFATAAKRAEEDFATSMERSQTDFDTSRARSVEDFATSLADTNADFAKAMADMGADFNKQLARSVDDYTVQVARANEQFKIEDERSAKEFAIQRARSLTEFTIQMAHMGEDFKRQMGDAEKDFNRSQNRAETAFQNNIERMRERASNAISDIGAQAAAQIKSMQEAFVQMFQQAPKNPKDLAEAARQTLLSMGVDKKLWGDEMKAAWDYAMQVLNSHKQTVSLAAGVDQYRPMLPTPQSAAPAAKPSFDTSRIAEYRPMIAPPDPNMLVEAGKAVIAGFVEGVKTTWESVKDNVRDWLGDWLPNAVKQKLGISSPSKVFKGIGEDIVDGLKAGLLSIGSVWALITAPLDKLNVMTAVDKAFTGVEKFLTGLDSDVKTWVGSAWNELVAPLNSLDPKAKVSELLGRVATWLSSQEWLASLTSAASAGWKGITEGLPTATSLLNAVKDLFGVGKEQGVLDWFGTLHTLIAAKMPTPNQFADAMGNVKTGFQNVLKDIVLSWNKFDFAPKLSFPGAQNLGAVSWGGFTIDTGLGQKTIGGGSFGGIDLPQWSVNLPDMIPNIPVPNFANFALGGVVTRQTQALIGEAGYPEAVIPLNQRGAEVLAATMARYVDNHSAQNALVSPYATSVVNNYNSSVYDHSTQFNGDITVQAQDPDQMAKLLEARARRQALAQPIRGRQ